MSMTLARIKGYIPSPMLSALSWGYHLVKPATLIPFDRAFDRAVRFNETIAQPVEIPEVLAMELEEAACYLQSRIYWIPKDYGALVRDAGYCSVNNVVMTSQGAVVAESLSTGLDLTSVPVRKKEALAGYYALWRSRKNGHYHTLIDNLPRLLSLRASPFAELDTIKLLCPGSLSPVESYLLERFCPENVEIFSPPAGPRYRLENLVFTPFKTRRFAGYLPQRYAEPIRSILLPKRPSTRAGRLFISRENAPKRTISNQPALCKALARRGFEKVILEDLPFEEQIQRFYDAEVIVGPHGAGLANMLFANPGTVVELFPSPFLAPHYFYLSKSLGHRYAYWCGSRDFRHDAFEVDVSAVCAMLDRMGIRERKTT